LAQRGAKVTAIDIAEDFIAYAQQAEADEPLGIKYRVASAVALPFPDIVFDFATGFMSFMDIPETERVVAEAHRVLKPGGFLQFSILHPCFNTSHRRNLRNEQRLTYAIEVGDYFRNRDGEIERWLFSTVPLEIKQRTPPFKIPLFTRTVSQWLNLLIETGFVIEHVEEPRPSDAVVRACPAIQDAQVTAYFLHLRVRKP
jgi:SAM-dependent methyltransferase